MQAELPTLINHSCLEWTTRK